VATVLEVIFMGRGGGGPQQEGPRTIKQIN